MQPYRDGTTHVVMAPVSFLHRSASLGTCSLSPRKTALYGNSEEEFQHLQAVPEHCPHFYPFILGLFRTGMREGEVVPLRPEDVDLQARCVCGQRGFTAGQLSNTPKSRQRRTVDLSRDLVAVLKDYLVVRETEAMLKGQSTEGWLLTTPHGENIQSNNFRDRVWKPLLKAAGLPYRWVHATRHNFARYSHDYALSEFGVGSETVGPFEYPNHGGVVYPLAPTC